ncbi:Acyl-CoA desaturase BmorQPVE1, partial [Operophtera brumata]
VAQLKNIGTDYTFKHEVVWKNAIGFFILHVFAFCGFYLIITGYVRLVTVARTFLTAYVFSEGITIGAHRLYTHKSFKATPLLKAILIVLQCGAGQNSIFIWSRDHRLHHRYSDTIGDPHNAKRGFFFSHIGWLMTKKHPYLYILIAIVLPVWVPVHFFGETLWHSLLVCYFFRYVYQLNGTWLVNSAAHIWGSRPYDQNLQPVESWFVSFLSLGEGWHNYHHAFPWDYKAAELTMHFNFSATLIRFLETIGLAYDLKTASPEMVEKRIMRTGDGTHYKLGSDEARSSFTAIGPLHPLNPLYTTKFKEPEATLSAEGLPLFHEKDVFNLDSMKRVSNKFSEMILNKESLGTDLTYKHEIIWKNAFGFSIMHILAAYGFYEVHTLKGSTTRRRLQSRFICKLFSRYLLLLSKIEGFYLNYIFHILRQQTCRIVHQKNSLFVWARDHRLHHRFSDTDGDPHNSKRGFFFCHMGWLMAKKHPYVSELGRKIDISDLIADPLVMWQKKYYYHLYFLVAFLIPVAVPVYFFGETWTNAVLFCYFARYMFTLHVTWLVNSAAHLYGTRPYDKNLQPVESWFVSLVTLGEGWHNYHHTFPWDYKAAEQTMPLNFSATLIRFLEKIGLAYDLKSADPDMMKKRIIRTGDGTHYILGTDEHRSAVTAIGPLHPLNPTYTTTFKAPDAVLKAEGLPLYHEKDLLNIENTERFSNLG